MRHSFLQSDHPNGTYSPDNYRADGHTNAHNKIKDEGYGLSYKSVGPINGPETLENSVQGVCMFGKGVAVSRYLRAANPQ